MSIRDLAKAANVSPQTIVSIEAGRTAPRPSTMKQVAAALGVEPAGVDEFAAAIKRWTEGGDRDRTWQKHRPRPDAGGTGR